MFEQLLGQYGWIAVTFGLGFFFKESIMNMIQGMLVFIGNDFNNYDIIYISGREARIVRVGITKTVFYMTDRGTKMIVPNEKLKDLTMEKIKTGTVIEWVYPPKLTLKKFIKLKRQSISHIQKPKRECK